MGLALVLVFAVTLSGCSGGKAKNTGKKIVMARPVDSNNLDPIIQASNPNIWVLNLVMEGLVSSDDKGTRNDVPALATEWKMADDKKSITFTLRPGVKFSDGTALTAEDVVWSLERARTTKESPWAFALVAITKTEVVDKTHVKISLKQPWGPIFADLAMFNAVITSKAYFEKVGAKAFSEKPLGTGPFLIAEWMKGDHITLTRNPYYWQKGKPLVDEIRINVVPDDNTRIMQLKGGQVDMVETIPFSNVADLQKDSNINMLLPPALAIGYIGFNNTKPPFNDPRVRNALAYATDKTAIVKMVLFGQGEVATSFMAKADPNWNPNVKGHPYDLDKAKQLLKDAGFASGLKLEIVINPGSVVTSQIATILKDQWKRAGVDVTIKQMDAASLTPYIRTFQYQVNVSGWTYDMIDSSEIAERTAVSGISKNLWTGWGDSGSKLAAQAEELTYKAEAEVDPAKAKGIYYQIQEIYDQDAPRIPVYYAPYTFATSKKITGFVQNPLGVYRFENLDKTTGK